MADFNASINLVAKVEKALKDVQRIERQIEKIRETSIEVKVKESSIKKVEERADALTRSFLTANKAAAQLSTTVKAFLKGFVTGPAEELARALQAANKESEILLKNTTGYISILKEVAREQAAAVEQQRRTKVAQKANVSTLAEIEGKIRRIKAAQDNLVIGSRAQENVAKTLNQLEETRNEILKRRESQLSRIRKAQEEIGEQVRKNIRDSKAARTGSEFNQFQRSVEDRRAVQGALRRQGLVDVDPIGPATKLGSLDADRQRFEFAEQKEKELAALTSQLEDRINREEKASAERLFQLKLQQIEKLGAAQLEQIKRVNQAELDDFDRKFDETVRKKQRAFDAPIGPGNAEGIAEFRRIRKEVERTAEIQKEADARAERSAQRRLKAEKKIRQIKKDAAKRRKDLEESLALGVGFPLLFGGGPGSILGSAAGSFAGKGFGGQIIAGGIGQAIDQLVSSSARLASSFAKTENAAEALIENNFVTSESTKKLIQAQLDAGRTADAAATAQRELNTLLGTEQANLLQQTGQAVNELGRELSVLFTTIQLGLANDLKPFIESISEFVGRVNVRNQVDDIANLLDQQGNAEQRKRFNKVFQDPAFKEQDVQTRLRTVQNFRKQLEEELGIRPIEVPVKLKLQNNLASLGERISQLGGVGDALSAIERFSGNNDAASRQRIQNQRAIEDQERRVAQFRLGVERKIQDIRLQVIQEQNRQADRQAALARQSAALDNRASERSALVNSGTDPLSNTTQSLLQSANTFTEALRTAQDERLKKNRDNALELQRLEIQSARAVADLQRQAADINLQAARKAADIADRRRNLDTDLLERRFRFEKLISSLRLQEALVQVDLDRQRAVEAGTLNEQVAARLQERKDIIREAQAVVRNAERPQQAAEVASAGTGPLAGFDLSKLNAVNQQLSELISNRTILTDAEFASSVRSAGNAFLEQNKALLQSLGLLRDRQRLLERQKAVKDLVSQGFSREDAGSIVQGRELFNTRQQQLVKNYETILKSAKELFALPEDIIQLPQITALIVDFQTAIKDIETQLKNNETAAEAFFKSFKKVDKVQEDLKKLATEIADLFATGFTDSIVDAVTGVKTLSEAFQDLAADILKAIGRALILSAITKALGAVGTDSTPGTGILGDLFRADGGPVKKGQPYIVGEEGPELIVPSESGTVLPNEVFDEARGALRGSATANADDASDAFFAAAGALERNTQVINNRQSTTQQETSFNNFTEALVRTGESTVRFETVKVGDMDVVTKEEAIEIGIKSAKAAEANVFAAMRNKPSVRRSLGMG